MNPIDDLNGLSEIKMFPMDRKISKYREQIDEAINSVLNDNNFILGTYLEKFEKDFGSYLGVKYCAGVANGSDAIEIGLTALNLKSGTEVITVANAGNYASGAILSCGLKPKYVDIDSQTLNVDGLTLQDSLNGNVSAVILTHLYGNPIIDVERLVQMCHSKGVFVIEDCAQSHGAIVNQSKVGTFGDLSTFSFYPTKNLGCLGDGGMVATNSVELYQRISKLRNYGWGEKYRIELVGGRNSRLDEMQAALLSAFLENLDIENSYRESSAKRIIAGVSNANLKFVNYGQGSVFHLLVLLTKNRKELIQHLKSHLIRTDIHYPVMDYSQPGRNTTEEYKLVHSVEVEDQILSIPLHPYLTESEINQLIESLNSFKI